MYEFGTAEVEAAVRVLTDRQLFRYLPDANEADRFEQALARALGVHHAVVTTSGTAAMICGLAAMGIGPGDEVIVPAYGFVAGVLAPLAVGAVPVVCDIDESLTLDPADAAAKLTSRTRAVLPVHMHGAAADMDAVMTIAAKHGLAVLEDACQALGGTYRGRPLGTIGDLGAFSFNQHKIITAGEGGALVTDHTSLYERSFIAHDGSCSFSRHQFTEPIHGGLAFRMNEVSAAILNVQLGRLDTIMAGLRAARDRVSKALTSAAVLRPVPWHDAEGACGTHLGYTFDNAETAGRFQRAVDGAELDAFFGNACGHSFGEWELLHQGRGAYHPLRNPLRDTHWRQLRGACSRSEDILQRTVLVRYGLRVSDTALEKTQERLARELG